MQPEKKKTTFLNNKRGHGEQSRNRPHRDQIQRNNTQPTRKPTSPQNVKPMQTHPGASHPKPRTNSDTHGSRSETNSDAPQAPADKHKTPTGRTTTNAATPLLLSRDGASAGRTLEGFDGNAAQKMWVKLSERWRGCNWVAQVLATRTRLCSVSSATCRKKERKERGRRPRLTDLTTLDELCGSLRQSLDPPNLQPRLFLVTLRNHRT
jgi:hypothetical protein